MSSLAAVALVRGGPVVLGLVVLLWRARLSGVHRLWPHLLRPNFLRPDLPRPSWFPGQRFLRTRCLHARRWRDLLGIRRSGILGRFAVPWGAAGLRCVRLIDIPAPTWFSGLRGRRRVYRSL